MIQMTRRAIAAAALAATTVLAACEATPTSPNVGPGPTPLSAGEAAAFFQTVCVNNRNNVSGMRATLATMPFVLNTSEGRYYHQQVDLSFVVDTAAAGRSYCEMGWRTFDSFEANRNAIQRVAPGAQVPFDPSLNFLRAVLIDAV